MERCLDEGVITECEQGELETSGNMETDRWQGARSLRTCRKRG